MGRAAPFSARLLASNAAWNFVGQAAPMLAAVVCIPRLIHGMGVDRFGVLTLAWMVTGYFGLFDFGLGRALTKLVAEKLGTPDEPAIPGLVWTGLFLMLLFGLVGAGVLALCTPTLVTSVFKIPPHLHAETRTAFYLLDLSIPVVISTASLRGVVEAQQRFALLSYVRVPTGIFSFAGPALALAFSNSLVVIVAVLVAGRAVAWLAHLVLCLHTTPSLRSHVRWDGSAVRPLVSFGGWMTVSNVISPIMVYLDRFMIGALISMSAVAYYATPLEMVTKLLIVAWAVSGVLFPAFSSSFAQDRSRTVWLYTRGVFSTFAPLLFIAAVLIGFSHEILTLWLGADFANHSAVVLQLLAVGIFIYSLAHIPFALVQGAGRPDLTAKLHLAEIPFYVVAAWWLITHYGVTGAAIAWVTRIAADAVALFWMAERVNPDCARCHRQLLAASLVVLAFFGVSALGAGILLKTSVLLTGLALFSTAAWLLVGRSEQGQARVGIGD